MYPLPVDAKNHEMTSVSRGPRVQDRAAPQQMTMACVKGTMALVMGKVVNHATQSSLSLDPVEKWTWESGSVSFSVIRLDGAKISFFMFPPRLEL